MEGKVAALESGLSGLIRELESRSEYYRKLAEENVVNSMGYEICWAKSNVYNRVVRRLRELLDDK